MVNSRSGCFGHYYIGIKGGMIKFYKWGGGPCPYSWSFGWLCGRDGDLVCVKRNTTSTGSNNYALSPVCSNRLLAFIAFILSAILVRIDQNLWIGKE